MNNYQLNDVFWKRGKKSVRTIIHNFIRGCSLNVVLLRIISSKLGHPTLRFFYVKDSTIV